MACVEETNVGIQVSREDLNAQSLGIIRKKTRLSIAEIQSRAEEGRCVFECDETDDEGIGFIISLYEELAKLGFNPALYEDGGASNVESLKQSSEWYRSMEQEDD